MTYFKIFFLLAALVFGALADGAQAQGLGSLLPGVQAETTEDDVSEIVRSAAENGVSVIVIDPAGNILSQSNAQTAETPADPVDASMLMKAQTDANAFRDALVDRLIHLPDAFNEVLYILRAA
ncbi:MAG: mechanosensitive ion channel family protein, partial [Pseudomonadota bacterium]